jgi:hypothetical protein
MMPNVFTPKNILEYAFQDFSYQLKGQKVLLQGIYQKTGLNPDSKDYYYDELQEVDSDKKIALAISKDHRENIPDGSLCDFEGYLNIYKFKANNSIGCSFRVVNVAKIEDSNSTSFDELITKIQEIKKTKSLKPSFIFEYCITTHLEQNETIPCNLILGNNAIVEKDVYEALGEDLKRFNFIEKRINFDNPDEIIQAIKSINKDEIIAIIRGGGDVHVFNDLNLVQTILENNDNPIVSAIGHKQDKTLTDYAVDQSFATPSLLGSGMKEIVREELWRQLDNKKTLQEIKRKHNRNNLILAGFIFAIIAGLVAYVLMP